MNAQTVQISEINPITVNKNVFSDDLCKLSFKVFTHNAPVEILYNPLDITFNAFALILFNLRNEFNLSNKLTVGKLPTDELTSGKLPLDGNSDKSEQKLRNKAHDKLMSWMRNKDNVDFIDRISLMLTGEYHFFYNDNPIWNEDGTIIIDILDSSGRVQIDKLTQKDDNIVKKINAGNSPLSGIWLNFEFLPEMLRISNMNYRVLANHFQAVLLPYLSNKNLSLEQYTNNKQRKLLWSQKMLDEIDKCKSPVEKGKLMEKYVATLLREVFPNSEEQNKTGAENVKIVSNHPHTCDIELINEKILVEVKAVKNDLTANDVKFINDVLAHPTTINAGIYVNLFDESLITRIEFNPLRFYINKYDFDDRILLVIKHTIDFFERKLIDTRETNRQFNSITKIKSLEQACIDYFYIDFKRIMMGILARAQLDPDLKALPIHTTDLEEPAKIERDVELASKSNEIDEAIKSFINIHYSKFINEYHAKEARKDIMSYLVEMNLPNPGDKFISTKLKTYLNKHRSSLQVGKFQVYTIKDEMENLFHQEEQETTNRNTSNDEMKEPPTLEEMGNKFFQLESIQSAINDEKGIKQDVLSARFKNFIKTNYSKKFKLNLSLYTKEFQSLALKRCVQYGKDKKHHIYISNETQRAKNYIQTLKAMINEEYEKDKRLNYTKFDAIYKSKVNEEDRLTKPIILKELNEVIKRQK